jgi:hypothetical protein
MSKWVASAVTVVCTSEPVCVCSRGDAVMSIVSPAIIAYSTGSGISPMVASPLVYTAVNQHSLLTFHNMVILVGEGDQGGNYHAADVFMVGLPLTVVVFTGSQCSWRCRGGGSLAVFAKSMAEASTN